MDVSAIIKTNFVDDNQEKHNEIHNVFYKIQLYLDNTTILLQ